MTSGARPPLWSVWLVGGVLVVAGYLGLPAGSPAQFLVYSSVALSAAVGLVLGVRLHRPHRAFPWYLLAAGQLCAVAGDAIYSQHVLAGAEPFPSLADGFYVASYPLLAYGLLRLVGRRSRGRDPAGLLDASVVATGVALLVWVTIMQQLLASEELGVLGRVVSLAYPIGDVLLLAVLARLLASPGRRSPSFWLFSAAVCLLLVADSTYLVAANLGIYDEQGILDVAWLLAYVLWGVAALHPSMREPSWSVPAEPGRISPRRLVLLGTASLLAPAVLITQGLRHPDRIDWLPIGLGSVVLFLLVVLRMAGLVQHVQRQAAQLASLAHHDALTGAPNRRAWDTELLRRLDAARRDGDRVVVALLDLDHFKDFNDRYGHQHGDLLLREAVTVWRRRLRPQELLARYGGEEFGLIFSALPVSEAVVAVDRLRAVTPQGQTFSAGVAVWDGREDVAHLVARADEALYAAKRAGRNRVYLHPDGAAAPTDRSGVVPRPAEPYDAPTEPCDAPADHGLGRAG